MTGYYQKDDGTVGINESEANLVREIYTLFADGAATNFSANEAVNSTTTRGAVVYNPTGAIATVPANSVSYCKVVVRLWIEGEDTKCFTNNYKALNKLWTLDLKMELGQGTQVTSLNQQP